MYRIGVGGGSASSIAVQGDSQAELDFGAVQRGDAEMEQKLNRVIRGCIEMCNENPICSIHDQGAGGNGRKTDGTQEELTLCFLALVFLNNGFCLVQEMS